MANPSIAMIGSFHRALETMQTAIDTFNKHAIQVVNPLSTVPFEPSDEFVRFETDEPGLSDAEIQVQALQRILGASAVYVVCPEGYVGKTTSYEWGFIEERQSPAYFSEEPEVWFMKRHAQDRIVTPQELAVMVCDGSISPIHKFEG